MAKNENRKNLTRTVHLGVYGDIGMRLLAAVKKLAQDSSYGTRLDDSSFRACELSRGPDNEILLDVYDDNWDIQINKTVFTRKPGKEKDDAGVRKWLAGVVKGATKLRLGPYSGLWNMHQAEIAKCDDWRRDCETAVKIDCQYEPARADNTFTVSQAYALYESLKGRNPKASRFAPGAVDQTVGEPFDPVRTEIETFRREETKRIEAEHKAEQDAIGKWYSDEYTKLEAERRRRRDEAEKSRDEKLAAMNAEIDASLAEAGVQTQRPVPEAVAA